MSDHSLGLTAGICFLVFVIMVGILMFRDDMDGL